MYDFEVKYNEDQDFITAFKYKTLPIPGENGATEIKIASGGDVGSSDVAK